MNTKGIAIIFSIGILLSVLILPSCTKSKDTSAGNQEPVVFDAREIKVGDTVDKLTVTDLEVSAIDDLQYYAIVHFDGEITLSGQLHIIHNDESSEGWGLGNYFQPDEVSVTKIPVLNIEPTRNGFTIDDNAEGSLASLKQKAGVYEATIIIRDYQIWSTGKAQENRASLVEIKKCDFID